MTDRTNHGVVLRRRTTGLPTADMFELTETAMPELADGEVLVHNIYVSADPGMKGWVSTATNYNSVEVGETMHSGGVGEVVASRNGSVPVGTYVAGTTGWQEYGVASPSDSGFRVVDPSAAPLSVALGALGMTGLTAYFGLLEVGQPQAGETVLVSTAAGSVGSAVGQIAKVKGCRTVGIAGGPEKVGLCREVFGYDAAIDYKSVEDLSAALREACPEGIDVYFDNVGGATLDAVVPLLNQGGRVAICGTASTASWDPPPIGVRLERYLLVNRVRIQGFLVFDFQDRYAEALADLTRWVGEGRLAYREAITEGLENASRVLAGLYEGANLGRAVIQVRPDPNR
jgi:NADPH-dependent curcumin reductase CurA